MENILAKVKLALRIITNEFDSELTDLINACLLDLGIAGVDVPYTSSVDTSGNPVRSLTDPLVIQAVITYCKVNFGEIDGVEMRDRLKASYDEQKAQLGMATGYTDWLK